MRWWHYVMQWALRWEFITYRPYPLTAPACWEVVHLRRTAQGEPYFLRLGGIYFLKDLEPAALRMVT